MNYGSLFSRAWNITWRHKFLWVLGFVVSLIGGAEGEVNFWSILTNVRRWLILFDPGNSRSIVVAVVVILITLLLWLVAIVARTGLIIAAEHLSQNKETTLYAITREGVTFVKPMAGMDLLLYGSYLVGSLLVNQALTSTNYASFVLLFAILILIVVGVLLTVLHLLAWTLYIFEKKIGDGWIRRLKHSKI